MSRQALVVTTTAVIFALGIYGATYLSSWRLASFMSTPEAEPNIVTNLEFCMQAIHFWDLKTLSEPRWECERLIENSDAHNAEYCRQAIVHNETSTTSNSRWGCGRYTARDNDYNARECQHAIRVFDRKTLEDRTLGCDMYIQLNENYHADVCRKAWQNVGRQAFHYLGINCVEPVAHDMNR